MEKHAQHIQRERKKHAWSRSGSVHKTNYRTTLTYTTEWTTGHWQIKSRFNYKIFALWNIEFVVLVNALKKIKPRFDSKLFLLDR